MKRRDALLALAAAPLALSGCRGDPAARLIGKDMPDVTVRALTGERFALHRLGRPAVVRFWGLWCPPCVKDEPHWTYALKQIRQERTLDGLVILSVHVGAPPETGPTLSEWAARRDREAVVPVIDDPVRTLAEAVAIPGTPSTLLVDPMGVIRDHSWTFKHARGARSFVAKVKHVLA